MSGRLSRLLQFVTCLLLLTQSFAQSVAEDEDEDIDPTTYIVYMGAYPKGVKSSKLLHTRTLQRVFPSKVASDAVLHSYKSFNAFVARLTKEEAVKMRELDDVVSVIPNRKSVPQTYRSWDYLGFPKDVQRSTYESNIIVGVIDSGIWPESDSFNPEGFGPPPRPNWNVNCSDCNNKIVVQRYFRVNGVFKPGDKKSARDTNGHGTHCASVAAGNVVNSVSLSGVYYGTVRGGVPSARIAAYKVCWSDGCYEADILGGYDAAIADGVDIISASLGPGTVTHTQYFRDIHAIGAFHALKKGILTSKSADNLGPKLYSISNTAPWFISVAASNIDGRSVSDLQLGNGNIYKGVSINAFDIGNRLYPLIFGGDAPNITGGYDHSQSRFCGKNSLDPSLVKGKIVLCEGHLDPEDLEYASGAAGVIFTSDYSVDGNVFALPTIHVSDDYGKIIYNYIKSTRNPTATILKSYEETTPAPFIASFSSRGPDAITRHLLKPDITAPGVKILAAFPRSPYYTILSGTSMACPHVTAVAAYVKSFNRNWSPAAIKSALMTTATPMSATLNAEAEFAYGAGQINPIRATNPGLVYDVSEIDYVQFLCGQGYSSYTLQRITGDSSTCTQSNEGLVWDLNLPSFTLYTSSSKNNSVVFHRTVTNVGSATSRYTATITAHQSSLNIQVEPSVLAFSYLGQKLSFKLKIEGYINAKMVSSSLVWNDGKYQVRSPIVAYTPQLAHPGEELSMNRQAE